MKHIAVSTDDLTMSSLDFLSQVINPAREKADESKIENYAFNRKLADELDLEEADFKSGLTESGQKAKVIALDYDQMMLVGMRESKAVRKTVLAKIKELAAPAKPHWMEQISPQAMVVIEDLSHQLDAANEETHRLQGVCNTMADQFAIGLSTAEFAKQLNGVNSKAVNNFLLGKGWVFKRGTEWFVASYARDNYLKQDYIEKKIGNGVSRPCSKVTLTRKGAKRFYKYYLDQQLPMKADWDKSLTHIMFEDAA